MFEKSGVAMLVWLSVRWLLLGRVVVVWVRLGCAGGEINCYKLHL